MRSLAALLLAVPLVAACGATTSGGPGSSASCVGPYLDATPPGEGYGDPPPTVRAGGDLTIYGHWFTSTCNDTNHNIQPLVAMRPETLTLSLPGGTTVPLGTFAPGGEDFGFSTTLHVPGDTPAGPALVADDEGRTFRFRIDAR